MGEAVRPYRYHRCFAGAARRGQEKGIFEVAVKYISHCLQLPGVRIPLLDLLLAVIREVC